MATVPLTAEEEGWVEAAEAADEGRGIELRFVNLNSESEMQEAFDALAVKGLGPKSRLRKFIRQLQTQQRGDGRTQWKDDWFLVTGVIRRPRDFGGTRYKLIKLALGNFYPEGMTVDEAFQALMCPDDNDFRLLKFSVVFARNVEANKFVADVDMYVNGHSQLQLLGDADSFAPAKILPFDGKIILASHYVARENEGDPPEDSPVWNVEYGSAAFTEHTSYIDMRDEKFLYQRIEADCAFQRAEAESAHIFPSAKCVGVYKWLDDKDFNRLALSRDGHVQYDGTGRGRGKRPKTTPKATLQPLSPTGGLQTVTMEESRLKKIPLGLWCKTEHDAKAWIPFLEEGAILQPQNRFFRITGPRLAIYCGEQKSVTLLYEEQQNPDGTTRRSWVTKVPGLADPTTAHTWHAPSYSVRVYEIMVYLLQWNFDEITKMWSLEGS